MRQACWVVFFAAVAGLAAAACSGGNNADNNGAGETPTAAASIVPATPFVTAATIVPSTPFPAPIITGNHLESPKKGYAVDFPDGWTVDWNIVTFGSATSDAFFSPNEIAGVQPSISVRREEIGNEFTFETYVDAKIQTAQGMGGQSLVTEKGSTVAGQQTLVITYGLMRDSIRLEKRDVVFVSDGFGWMITLTVPAGQLATFEPLFDELLSSFQLLGPAQGAAGAE
jgi:hypothetical protein